MSLILQALRSNQNDPDRAVEYCYTFAEKPKVEARFLMFPKERQKTKKKIRAKALHLKAPQAQGLQMLKINKGKKGSQITKVLPLPENLLSLQKKALLRKQLKRGRAAKQQLLLLNQDLLGPKLPNHKNLLTQNPRLQNQQPRKNLRQRLDLLHQTQVNHKHSLTHLLREATNLLLLQAKRQ